MELQFYVALKHYESNNIAIIQALYLRWSLQKPKISLNKLLH